MELHSKDAVSRFLRNSCITCQSKQRHISDEGILERSLVHRSKSINMGPSQTRVRILLHLMLVVVSTLKIIIIIIIIIIDSVCFCK